MPIKHCQENGKPGYKYGDRGKCYTYTPGNKRSESNALGKANKQRAAIKHSGYKE